MLNKFILSILIFSIYLINIQFFFVGTLAFKPIHVFAVIYTGLFFFKVPSLKNIIFFLFISLLVFLGYFNALDKVEFWKSFFMLTLSLGLIFFGPNLIRKISYDRKINFFYFLFSSYKYVVLYGFIQFISKNFLGVDFLYNNLGQFQYHPHYDNDLFGFTRATSVFYEPSVFGWVSNLIITILLVFRERIGMPNRIFFKFLVIFLIGLLVSLSSSAFVSFIVIYIIFLAIKYKRKKIYIFLFLPLIFLIIWLVLPYLRIEEFNDENTSGYSRVIFPFLNLLDVLKTYPYFGRGLGQIGVNDMKLFYDGVIHNSIYGFFITFGFSGLILFMIVLRKFYTYIKRDSISILLWLNLILILSTTGSFLSLELPFIYLIVYTLFSVLIGDNRNGNELKYFNLQVNGK
jgi:hypothetical protein